MPYLDIQVETEPQDLASDAYTYLQAQVPGWQPYAGNLESWLIESLAQIAGELRTLVSLVPDEIFQAFGATIMGLPPYAAVSATGQTVWTARDTAGYTITAGTIVAVHPTASSDAFTFQTVADAVIPAGQTSVGAQITAVIPGAASSG